MEEMVKIKVRPLSPEAFRPYGQILERGALIYPETEEGRVAMELLRLRRRPQHSRIEQLAFTRTRSSPRSAPYARSRS